MARAVVSPQTHQITVSGHYLLVPHSMFVFWELGVAQSKARLREETYTGRRGGEIDQLTLSKSNFLSNQLHFQNYFDLKQSDKVQFCDDLKTKIY